MKIYVGLDIGKTEIFEASPSDNGIEKIGTFANTEVGRQQFIHRLSAMIHCVMEATGLYHFP